MNYCIPRCEIVKDVPYTPLSMLMVLILTELFAFLVDEKFFLLIFHSGNCFFALLLISRYCVPLCLHTSPIPIKDKE